MVNIKTLFPRCRKVLLCWAGAIAIAALPATWATAQRDIFDLRKQIEDAKVIIVGRALSVQEGDRTEIKVGGQLLPAKLFVAQLQVNRTLKGNNIPPQVTVRFTLPFSPAGSVGYPGVDVGTYRIFLLRQPEGQFEFANAFLPSLPALARTPLSPSNDVLTAVLLELASVVDSTDTAEAVKVGVIFLLGSTSSQGVEEILRPQLTAPSPAIRASAAAALVQHRDLAALGVAQQMLSNPPAAVPRYLLENLSSAIGRYVNDPEAIPMLCGLLGAREAATRQAAALALRNTASRRAIPALGIALQDEDREVRYYAVIGLGEITGQPEWRPLEAEFQGHEQRYVDYWRNWVQQNVNPR